MRQDLEGKTVFVTGGSGGLGKAISLQLAARGAHITLFSRRPGPLEEARNEILAACPSKRQEINAVQVDMADAEQVDALFRAQPRIPDVLYCAAGGNHAENGFLLDIGAKSLESCMRNNYYSSAFAAKSVLDIWIGDDKAAMAAGGPVRPQKLRQIVFINSAAAFVALPGSVAYTPAKCAVRALADTLRMEVLRYCSATTAYSVHCAFPADFVSPGFRLEQATKTRLTKRIQGTDLGTMRELEAKFPSSAEVAALVIASVDRGDFIICEDSPAASVLFANMLGPSPKRGWGVFDALMGPVMGWLVMPFLRRSWERMTRLDGEEFRRGWARSPQDLPS